MATKPHATTTSANNRSLVSVICALACLGVLAIVGTTKTVLRTIDSRPRPATLETLTNREHLKPPGLHVASTANVHTNGLAQYPDITEANLAVVIVAGIEDTAHTSSSKYSILTLQALPLLRQHFRGTVIVVSNACSTLKLALAAGHEWRCAPDRYYPVPAQHGSGSSTNPCSISWYTAPPPRDTLDTGHDWRRYKAFVTEVVEQENTLRRPQHGAAGAQIEYALYLDSDAWLLKPMAIVIDYIKSLYTGQDAVLWEQPGMEGEGEFLHGGIFFFSRALSARFARLWGRTMDAHGFLGILRDQPGLGAMVSAHTQGVEVSPSVHAPPGSTMDVAVIAFDDPRQPYPLVPGRPGMMTEYSALIHWTGLYDTEDMMRYHAQVVNDNLVLNAELLLDRAVAEEQRQQREREQQQQQQQQQRQQQHAKRLRSSGSGVEQCMMVHALAKEAAYMALASDLMVVVDAAGQAGSTKEYLESAAFATVVRGLFTVVRPAHVLVMVDSREQCHHVDELAQRLDSTVFNTVQAPPRANARLHCLATADWRRRGGTKSRKPHTGSRDVDDAATQARDAVMFQEGSPVSGYVRAVLYAHHPRHTRFLLWNPLAVPQGKAGAVFDLVAHAEGVAVTCAQGSVAGGDCTGMQLLQPYVVVDQGSVDQVVAPVVAPHSTGGVGGVAGGGVQALQRGAWLSKALGTSKLPVCEDCRSLPFACVSLSGALTTPQHCLGTDWL